MPRHRLARAAFCVAVFAYCSVGSGGAGVWSTSAARARNRSGPDSPHGALDLACETCHTAEGWTPAHISSEFDHGKYGFELSGAHAAADCGFCHRSLEFEALDPDCVSCHQDVHSGTFGTNCADCHGTRSFIDRSDQVAMHHLTRFPLTGQHASLDCDRCHDPGPAGAGFVGTSTDCVSCHRPDYQAAVAPNHVQSGFGTDCSECHGTIAWAGAGVGSHDFFPLRGGHGGLECASCHTSGQFTRIDATCVACHRDDYDATVEPAHAPAGFTTDCAGCHTIQTWTGGTFDHATTAFPLTGGHREAECGQCHVQVSYSATPTECNGCHNPDYVAAQDPNHVTARFAFECEDCHTTVTWDDASYDHALSIFPLTGAHVSVECAQCHVNSVYTGTPQDCDACHHDDFVATTDPGHMASGFGTDCEVCHSTLTWEGAEFDHALSAFPLTGAHMTVECMQCHVNSVYTGTPQDCDACHHDDFLATTNPAHQPAGFGTDCEPCHTTVTWDDATFDHDPWFPIDSGAHRGEWNDCSECHTNPSSYAFYDCLVCHPHSDKSKVDGDHRGENGYTYTSAGCYDCHPRGRE